MMLAPIKVLDLELSQPLPTLTGLAGYMGFKGIVRLHGVPLGYIDVPIVNGGCSAASLGKAVLDQHSWAIVEQTLRQGLASPLKTDRLHIEDLLRLPPPGFVGDYPLVTVAVCTRDRPEDIDRCLAALVQLDYPQLDVLVVDNAPATEATKILVESQYPTVRYVREPRPGLDWARNRAILAAKGEIIAFTDDDVVVDRLWVKAIAQAFVADPEVMAVTGLVVPYELETTAQTLFEDYGGFGRGFARQRYQCADDRRLPPYVLGAGQFGTGANMAYRRAVFAEIGYFDPALDVGTPTNGCGDLEMFIRILRSGYALIYEPAAMIRHRHRREYAKLRQQIGYNGSLYALWQSIGRSDRKASLSCLMIGLWWFQYWYLRRLVIALLHRAQFPRDLVMAELGGAFKFGNSYGKSLRQMTKIVQRYGHQCDASGPLQYRFRRRPKALGRPPIGVTCAGIAVRTVELSQTLQPLVGLERYRTVRLFITWQQQPIQQFDYGNHHDNVDVLTLARLITTHLGTQLLDPLRTSDQALIWANALKAITDAYGLTAVAPVVVLPATVSVSIVVATFDRPDDLRNCLRHLKTQQTDRPIEIVVVDNHPASGLSRPVLQEFPDVIVVEEARQGLAYARNAGFAAATGDILIATDDDVTVPANWVEQLVTPFARADVMVVTGNVLPIALENEYQQAFENYGGLGRGFERREVSGAWYDLFPHKPSPTWTLGATANAAFRAVIFESPEIGLMDESLGPGMPSGVGEDTYLFYKVLKAGYTIVYEPQACVWHKHRNTQAALKKQLNGYSRGHVAYNLATWLNDGDWRALAHILLGLPYAHYYRIKARLLRRSDYPIPLILWEIAGNLAGPWAYWRSKRRVGKLGKSRPYVAPAKRFGFTE
jgi:O-antigen biosynthesis protein